ncbi:serine/threonine-protein phosphatase [Streptomyces microflavus]|uniref:PP2C family protein-serine/threonine phosphatase n=1 Tax=Streptomyces microflavus TaxID=1919 RepID=UPI00225BBB0C|nr:PP2C family protein-serine/threonine phosphatase [Streptomyces microflavus]MCX4657159.1 serine/threonine-protein phosphatase [Streptomyces microflavus]
MISTKRRGEPVVLSWLPIVVMAVVAAMDITAGPQAGFLPLVSLGPAFAGLIGTWRRTVLIGCAALLLCAGLGMYDGLFDTRRGYTAMASVAGVTLAGALAAGTRMRREAELASVRSIAEVAQRVLQRPVPRQVGPLQVAASYTSAVAESRIGGDLYEVVASPYGVRVIVGDVQGKGLAAVETAALVLGVFREAAHDEPDLTAIATRLERTVAREANGEKFVTAILAEIHTDEESIAFLNCGHPPPMIIRPDRSVDFPLPLAYALPIGIGTLGGDPPHPYRADFGPGEQLLLYTDGVTEARNAEGTFYPLEERAGLLDLFDADAALEVLRTDIVLHASGPHDDAAMLLLRHRSG